MTAGLLSSALWDLLPDSVIVTDASGRVLRASSQAEALLGYAEGGLNGQPLETWFGPGHSPRTGSVLVAARDLEGSRLLPTATGSPIDVEISGRDVSLDDGRAALILTLRSSRSVSVNRPDELSDRETTRALVEALRRNEERLAYASTVSEVGLFDHGLDPNAEPWWSPSLRAILGFGNNDRADFEWFQKRIHPEDGAILGAAVAEANSPSGDGRVVAEYRWLHPQKGYRWLLSRSATVCQYVDGQKVPMRALGAIIDVTERRGVEEDRKRRAAMLEASPDYVVIADLDGRLVDLNGAARALLGLEPGADIRHLTLADLYAPGPAEAERTAALAAAKKDGHWSGESEFRRHDGARVPVAQHILAHRDFSGVPRHVSTIARDLTKEKQLEEQFLHAQKMEAVGRLAGGVAHDFNNLLSVILGYAELAQMELPQEHSARGSLSEIARAAERAASLTSQLLAFGRRQILKPRVLDINETLTEFLPMVSRLVDERIEVQMIPSAEPANIKADPNQLQQVLLNLAVNARDAMPEGGTLTIEAFRSTLEDSQAARQLELAGGVYTVIAVSDTGHGMDEGTRARIFEPFFTTKGPHAGTGLGLSTVLGIVQQSGGNLWVYSEPGRGTTFKLYFPCTADAIEPVVPAPPVTVGRQSGVVLVVEDDEQVRNMVCNMLLRAGFEVLSASNPEQALQLSTGHSGAIDLLLTDVVMPKFSGAVLAEKLRETRPNVPVLFTSGYTENTIVHQGVLDASVNFLPKPVTPARLLAAVDEVLQATRRSHRP